MSENPWPNGVPEIMPAEDRAEIEELFARYAWGIDLADEEQAIATFAEDAEFDHLWQGKVAATRRSARTCASCGTTGSTGGTGAST